MVDSGQFGFYASRIGVERLKGRLAVKNGIWPIPPMIRFLAGAEGFQRVRTHRINRRCTGWGG
jgi:hypothetical protein